jgi:integrase
MKGYKQKRGKNSYRLAVYIGLAPDGTSEYIKETFHGSEKEADKRLAAMITEQERGEYTPPSKQTFEEYLIDWLEYIKGQVTEGTYENYYGYYKNHIKKDSICRIPITKVTALDIQRYVTKLSKSKITIKNRPEKTLSPKTIKDILSMIKTALKQACVWRITKDNPAQYVAPPKATKFHAKAFDDEEVVKFLEAAENDRFYFFFLIAIYLGMRQGEIRGLRWQDVDLKRCTLKIEQSVRRSGYKAKYKEPKTEGSNGTLPFESWMVPLFEKQKVVANTAKLKYGCSWNDNDLVFPSLTGNPIDLKILTKHFQQIIDKAGLERIRFHDLRHSCATLLLTANVHPKVVQERLRHAAISTTMDLYSHVIPKVQNEANKTMSKILKINENR